MSEGRLTRRAFLVSSALSLAVPATAHEEGKEASLSAAKSDRMIFVRIPAGSFVQGDDAGNWDEKPARLVRISHDFEIGARPISNAEYEAFDLGHRARRGAYGAPAGDADPVVCVAYDRAADYCRWRTARDGAPFRLPTEAEWELAAQNHSSALGDLDSVENWCQDWYGPYLSGPQDDPVGYATGDFRVTRGGRPDGRSGTITPATRRGALPADSENHVIGFRVVHAVAPTGTPLTARPAPRWARNVVAEPAPWHAAEVGKPYFAPPIPFVQIPAALQNGPLFTEHNHVPGIAYCDNGDLLAIWYSTKTETGRELAVAGARLRSGGARWEDADLFWNTPGRNDHAPALWNDGRGTLYHFNGLAAEGGWADLATIVRTSRDNGATWTAARIIAPRYGHGNMPIAGVFRRKDGAICLPCDADPSAKGGTVLHVSADDGATWTQLRAGAPPPVFANGGVGAWIAGIHAGVDQWTDGSLVAVGRGDDIDGKLALSVSRDGGATWAYSATPFDPIGGGQRPVLRCLREGVLLLVSFAKQAEFTGEDGKAFAGSGMFAALSYDGGKTWPVRKLLTDGVSRTLNGYGWTHEFTMDATRAEPAGYLAAVQSPDGMVHLISSGVHYRFNLAWLLAPSASARVPGVVIDHSPQQGGVWIGSPSIAILPQGEYVASHDDFGPKSTLGRTAIFVSEDRGRTWQRRATVETAYWSTLFVHRGALYLMGTSREYGFAVIHRSDDGGRTWTAPRDAATGLLRADGKYHCAPVPVVEHGGRLWRGMEDAMGPGGWGSHFRSRMFSAPVDADLLRAESWTVSVPLARDAAWNGGDFGGWLEGNAVVAPDSGMVNVLRVAVDRPPAKAAIVHVSADGRTEAWDPALDLIEFPGGATKFTIRYDPESRRYWSLANYTPPEFTGRDPGATRNTLALTTSADLRLWEVRAVLLHHPDHLRHGFQYLDWLFDGADIIAVSRTAYEDGEGGAHNYHDANYLTFHRIADFRTRTRALSPEEA
jgi:sulfatase modifying factor 1